MAGAMISREPKFADRVAAQHPGFYEINAICL
jgi:hypothetical protein